ncbi:hypothetical protein SAMN04487906_2758 [Zhouia amylolytica]|uniref:Uncharacterized protein n=1 Tax=Zhouia amylolytica TaxID=376730 RepID=A0A1I6V026_9FLAO|nr:hypothetical protein [Zhouia amylolytica]SFT07042.1 hypothetical protein SAMN04487906_2758 [Zhouia amylolytica]
MNDSGKKSIVYKSPAWIIAVITALVSFILPFIFAGMLFLLGKLIGISNEETGNLLAYLLTGMVIALMCFLICKAHPKAIWYAPVICNAITLWIGIGHLLKGNSAITIPFAIGWFISILAGIAGKNEGITSIPEQLNKP